MTHRRVTSPSAVDAERPTAPRGTGEDRRTRAGVALSILTGTLALTAATAGLLVDGVYGGDPAAAAMFRGYDLVAALVVVPCLAIASRAAWRSGGVRSHLVVAGLVAYLVYTYAYYLFGTGFNDLFLLHVAVFAAGLAALVLLLAGMDAAAVADRFAAGARTRASAVLVGVLAVALGGMWIYLALVNAVTGEVPVGSRLVENDTVVHLGMALDLSVLVPLYAAAAALLWRHAPWGYVLAAIALCAGVLHQVSYLVALPFQVAADVPGAVSFDPGEPVIVLLYLVAGALLVSSSPAPR